MANAWYSWHVPMAFTSNSTCDVNVYMQHVQVAPCKRIHEGPGFRIPASPSIWILDSNPLDSGFQPSGFRIPKPLWIPDSSLWIPDSNNKNLLDSGFRIPLHGAIQGLSLPHTHTLFLYLQVVARTRLTNIQYFYMALELLNCWRASVDGICKSVNEKAVHTVKIHRHCRTNRESKTKSSLKLKPRISHAKRHTSDNKRNHQSGHHVHGFCGEIRTQG